MAADLTESSSSRWGLPTYGHIINIISIIIYNARSLVPANYGLDVIIMSMLYTPWFYIECHHQHNKHDTLHDEVAKTEMFSTILSQK